MPIVSHPDYCLGKPRLEGTRLYVSTVVIETRRICVEGFVNDHDDLNTDQFREALDCCRKERCVGHAGKFCVRCTKDTRPQYKDDPATGVLVVGDIHPLQLA